MIEIIKELNIEVSKPNIFQAVVAKQYDMNTRFIKATLVDGKNIIKIPTSNTLKVIINAERKDGQSQGFDGVINDDGTVTVPLHSWMLELDGTVICDISVVDTETDDNKKLTTTSFTLLVEKASWGGDGITSDPQYNVLIELLNSCGTAGETAQEALIKSNEALANSAEANSKYDACVEATANANNVLQDIKAGGYIESLKEINNGQKFSVWVGTQEEYDALPEKAKNCFYIITDDTSGNELVAYVAGLNERLAELENRNAAFTAAMEENFNAFKSETNTKITNVNNSVANSINAIPRYKELFAYDNGGIKPTSGAITIPGLSQYSMLAVDIAFTSDDFTDGDNRVYTVLFTRSGGSLMGTGCVTVPLDDSPVWVNYYVLLSVNGDTITSMTYKVFKFISGEDYAAALPEICNIYGIC